MKQSILKHGDLVRYHIRSTELDGLGFVIGQFYAVSKDGLGLYVRSNQDTKGIGIVSLDGELTEYADNFTKHRCPVTLPIGQLQRRGL